MKQRMLLQDFRFLLPPHHGSQEECFAWLAAAHTQADATAEGRHDSQPAARRRLERMFRRYGCSPHHIGWRRSELEDFKHTDWTRMQIFNLHEQAQGQGLEVRNRFFADTATRTIEELFRDDSTPPSDLLHVTCTGYSSPSAVQRLIDRKQWHAHTQATQVYHMGCYAALPALRVAAGLLHASGNGSPPRAEIIHTELCTLHFNPCDHSPAQMVVQSLFADGHARYSVVPENAATGRPLFEMLAVLEETVPGSLEDMTWVLSNFGFRMTLSLDVPAKIASSLGDFLTRLFAAAGEDFTRAREDTVFALHPGGPKIIDSIQELLNLNESQISHSRGILFNHGNMSSATLPHIWAKVADDAAVPPNSLVASLAFGPGLTVAGALFRKC